RSLDPARQDPDATADNILVHPDVRRMLLNIKSTNEALRGLATYIAMHYDIAHHHEDAETRQTSDDIVALLTPVMKSYGSERGFWNISEAMQVTGGAGYTQDWPIEQHLRDARIALIYEGTNHIQALDLVGRKLPRDNGRLIRSFQSEVTALIRECSPIEAMAEFIAPLKAESKRLTEVTMALGMKAFQDPEEAGAVANSYLNLFAMTTLAFVWCKQVHYALTQDTLIARAKIKTARFFFQVVLPEADTYARQIAAGKASMMDFDVEMF
ncbi:MAG: acyl-CoA dehydrogenase C-terminal domain-containing protein, partial [Myxococcota bacterium]